MTKNIASVSTSENGQTEAILVVVLAAIMISVYQTKFIFEFYLEIDLKKNAYMKFQKKKSDEK